MEKLIAQLPEHLKLAVKIRAEREFGTACTYRQVSDDFVEVLSSTGMTYGHIMINRHPHYNELLIVDVSGDSDRLVQLWRFN